MVLNVCSFVRSTEQLTVTTGMSAWSVPRYQESQVSLAVVVTQTFTLGVWTSTHAYSLIIGAQVFFMC